MINNLKMQIKQIEDNINYEKIHAQLQFLTAKKRFIKFLHSPTAIAMLFLTGTVIGYKIKQKKPKPSMPNATTNNYTGSKHIATFKNVLYFFSDILIIANLMKDFSYKLY